MSEKETFTSPENEQRAIRLDDLIDPNRTVPREYEQLIRAQEQRLGDARFLRCGGVEEWLDSNFIRVEGNKQWFAERLKNGILIDLGSGLGKMRQFAIDCGSTTYVSVDRMVVNRENLWEPTHYETNPLRPVQEHDPTETLHEIVIQADMLDFVSRLKNRSANLTINAIDSHLIPDEKYHEALARELFRVVKQGGIIFGEGSTSLYYISKNLREKPSTTALKEVHFKHTDEWDELNREAHVFECPE